MCSTNQLVTTPVSLAFSGSGRVQPVPFRVPVATLRRALPAAGPPPPEPLPVSLQRLLLGELLRPEESFGRARSSRSPGAARDVPLALSSSPVPGAVPAGQAGGQAGEAEGRGGLLHPAGAEPEPEAVPGGRGCVPVRQLSLAGLALQPAAALCLWCRQDP